MVLQNEIGVFEMRSEGLEQILNPSEFMLEGRPTDASGSVVACLMEGNTPYFSGNTGTSNKKQFWYAEKNCGGN